MAIGDLMKSFIGRFTKQAPTPTPAPGKIPYVSPFVDKHFVPDVGSGVPTRLGYQTATKKPAAKPSYTSLSSASMHGQPARMSSSSPSWRGVAQDQAKAQLASVQDVKPFSKTLPQWLSEPVVQKGAVPAGENEYGQAMVRMGEADPGLLARYKEGSDDLEPTPRGAIMSAGPMMLLMSGLPADRSSRIDKETKLDSARSPVLSTVNLINDLTARFSEAPSDYSTDPEDSKYEYQSPNTPGKWFSEDEVEEHYQIGDDVYTFSELEEAKSLSNGRVRLPRTGKTVSMDEYKNGPLLFRTLPDGTVIDYADGRKAPLSGQIQRRQVNPNMLGYGFTDPRYPWQDTAGNDPFIDDDWDPSNIVGFGKEGQRSSIDMLLQSLPYMTPPKIRYAVATARAVPYIYGYDADNMEKSGRGFEDLGSLGDVKYPATEMTRSQQIAGFMQPYVDATVENISGNAIGGIENLPGVVSKGLGERFAKTGAYRFLRDNPIGQTVGSAGMEGLEEIFSVPFGAATRDPLEDIWKDYEYDDDGNMVYKQTPAKARWKNAGREFLQSFAGGATMGGQFEAARQLGGIPRTLYMDRSRYRSPQTAKPAPEMDDESILSEDENRRMQE